LKQAYSYAVAEGGSFVWVTSRIKNEYYEVPEKKPKSRIAVPDIPPVCRYKGKFYHMKYRTQHRI